MRDVLIRFLVLRVLLCSRLPLSPKALVPLTQESDHLIPQPNAGIGGGQITPLLSSQGFLDSQLPPGSACRVVPLKGVALGAASWLWVPSRWKMRVPGTQAVRAPSR